MYNDNFEFTSTPILNSLYILQIYQISPITAIIQISVSVTHQIWYKRLDHLSYSNLKYFDHIGNINIKKMEMDNNLLLYKICIKVN